jgi:hypothetical protein
VPSTVVVLLVLDRGTCPSRILFGFRCGLCFNRSIPLLSFTPLRSSPIVLFVMFLLCVPCNPESHQIFFVGLTIPCQACSSILGFFSGNPPKSLPASTHCLTPGVSIAMTSSANVSGIVLRGTGPFLNWQLANVHRPRMCAQHTNGCPFATYVGPQIGMNPESLWGLSNLEY